MRASAWSTRSRRAGADFTVEPASKAKKTVAWVSKLLADKLSDGMEVPEELGSFKNSRGRSRNWPAPSGVPASSSRASTDVQVGAAIRVAEVWESVEAFRQFSAERFGPKAGEVGITVAPRISFRDIHC
nr:hypothetical protein [Nocardia tengchongensis]